MIDSMTEVKDVTSCPAGLQYAEIVKRAPAGRSHLWGIRCRECNMVPANISTGMCTPCSEGAINGIAAEY